MCDKFACKDRFMLRYCLGRYKTQEMCDKTVDAFLSRLKFVFDWFVRSKIMRKIMIIYTLKMI